MLRTERKNDIGHRVTFKNSTFLFSFPTILALTYFQLLGLTPPNILKLNSSEKPIKLLI